MPQIPWATALILVVLIGCLTLLVYKGLVSSHAIVGLAGAIVGFFIGANGGISAAILSKKSEKTEN